MAHKLIKAAIASTPLILIAGHAAAQTLPVVAPAVDAKDPEYQPVPVKIGPIEVSSGAEAKLQYDSNIYALRTNPVSDGVAIFAPYAQAKYQSGKVEVEVNAQARLRRYFHHTTENSDAGGVSAAFSLSPAPNEAFRLDAILERAIEDRGAPEARQNTAIGPRRINILAGNASYHRARGKLLLDLSGRAAKYDAVAAIDNNRDFSSYSGAATLGYRIHGTFFVTGTAFINRRDFRLATTPAGIKRNSTTFGGRLGVDVEPGGLIDGSISAGLFRHEPDDPGTPARTGLSLAGNLTYRPTRRAAVILDLSRGDVATFRNGASGRTDTIAQLTWQQEIRHNLYASVTAGVRDTKFVGTGTSQTTVIGRAGIEFRLNRNASIVADASYGSRRSDLPTEEFDRFRGGISLRVRF